MINMAKRALLIFVIIVLFLMFWMAIFLNQSYGANNYISQEVAIKYHGNYYSFHRNSKDLNKPTHWNDWVQWPMNKNTEKVRVFKSKQVDQQEVNKMLGPALIKWLQDQADCEGRSGYYNFTGNPLYDWKSFGGHHYGTYIKAQVLPVEASEFKHPVLKAAERE